MPRASARRSSPAKVSKDVDGADEDVEADAVVADAKKASTPEAAETDKAGTKEDEENEKEQAAEESVDEFLEAIKKYEDADILSRIQAMEQHAFDPANNLLNRTQFTELLELESETEPDFMQDIVDMYCMDSQEMLEELKSILQSEPPLSDESYDTARAALHKLRGSSSTLGAEGIQHTCEALRELCVNKDTSKLTNGPGGLDELERRLHQLVVFLKKYLGLSRECASRSLSQRRVTRG